MKATCDFDRMTWSLDCFFPFRVRGAEAAERARLIEEFRQRKREAAENKARGNYEYQPYSYQVGSLPLTANAS